MYQENVFFFLNLSLATRSISQTDCVPGRNPHLNCKCQNKHLLPIRTLGSRNPNILRPLAKAFQRVVW